MNKQQFQKQIKKERYQVFLFSSSIPLPLPFIKHTWLVTNHKGKVNRWEVWDFRHKNKTHWGHLNRNLFKPWEGRTMILLLKGPRYDSKLLGKIEGKKGSTAEKMVNFIEKEVKNYPYKHKFNYFGGPNCNSFVQWVLNKFPESKLKIPNKAWGKNFKF
ncbi:MAG: DUF3750 domain-containing protein [archaeon]|nr:DUF3750 domain-containing protein [Nanoarchaeota archaeon]